MSTARRVAICQSIRSGEYDGFEGLIKLVNLSEYLLVGDSYRKSVEDAMGLIERALARGYGLTLDTREEFPVKLTKGSESFYFKTKDEAINFLKEGGE